MGAGRPFNSSLTVLVSMASPSLSLTLLREMSALSRLSCRTADSAMLGNTAAVCAAAEDVNSVRLTGLSWERMLELPSNSFDGLDGELP